MHFEPRLAWFRIIFSDHEIAAAPQQGVFSETGPHSERKLPSLPGATNRSSHKATNYYEVSNLALLWALLNGGRDRYGESE
jgi:hypothetical protein